MGVDPSQIFACRGDSAHLVCAFGVSNDCFLLRNIDIVATAQWEVSMIWGVGVVACSKWHHGHIVVDVGVFLKELVSCVGVDHF